jgi:hypothetical protein
VDIQQTPEEKLKTIIYDIYTSFFDETTSDQREKDLGKIWGNIVSWWNNYYYHKIDAKEMGVEIFNVIKRLVKDNNQTKKDKSELFYILKKSMENAEKEYFSKYEQSPIKISREKKRKLKEVAGFIRMKESQLERKLTTEEQIQGISKWFKNPEYIELLNIENIGSLDTGNEETGGPNYADPHSDDPLDEYINKTDTEDVLEAVTSVLDKKQERARPCIKALFTLYCIKNNLKGLYPILDKEIIDSFYKHDKKPKQYEIYLKYHPETDKESAGVMAATNLREFLNDLETYLKKKNH